MLMWYRLDSDMDDVDRTTSFGRSHMVKYPFSASEATLGALV